jgi:hypothetical protein
MQHRQLKSWKHRAVRRRWHLAEPVQKSKPRAQSVALKVDLEKRARGLYAVQVCDLTHGVALAHGQRETYSMLGRFLVSALRS